MRMGELLLGEPDLGPGVGDDMPECLFGDVFWVGHVEGFFLVELVDVGVASDSIFEDR